MQFIAASSLPFKKGTRDGLLDCLKTVPLGTLRFWSSLVSITPVGPRNAKASFLTPLLDSFLQRCLDLNALSMYDLTTLAKMSPDSLAATRTGQIYQVLNVDFPSDLVRRFLK